jgi:HK97 family phage portal protein
MPNIIARARPRGTRPPVPMPTTITSGAESLAAILGLNTSNVYVSERNVRGLPAINGGVRKVAHAVAHMMTDAEVHTGPGQIIETPPIVSRPTVLLGSFEFWAQLVACVMMRGNYVGILADFDADGWPRQVVPVHPDSVTLDDTTGLPFYNIGSRQFRWDEVVHVRHGAPVGTLWGEGIVETYRRQLSIQLHEQAYAESSVKTGSVPSAVVTLDVDKVTAEVAEQVSTDWIDLHGGGKRKPAIVPRSMKIEPLSWSPEDAQFIEARQMSVAEAALICGLDPADLGATVGGSAMTYANLTDRQLARVLDSYSPWLRLVEQAWTDLLPGGTKVTGKVEALLRTSTKERLEIRALAQSIGVESREESRAEERPGAPALPPPPPAPAPVIAPAADDTDPAEETP